MAWHEIVQIVVAIGLGLLAIFRFRSAYIQRNNHFEQSNKIESAKFLSEYAAKFLQPPFYDYSKRIGKHIDDGTTFTIKDTEDHNRVLNYLDELENVSVFYHEGIITIEQLYEVFGNQILDTFRVNPIVDLINKEREKPEQTDLFDKLETTYYDLRNYQNEKVKSIEKSVIPYYDDYVPEPFSKTEK